ncbi:MAG: hypothetical protein U0441_05815 [Polyangiaceae bacterium]
MSVREREQRTTDGAHDDAREQTADQRPEAESIGRADGSTRVNQDQRRHHREERADPTTNGSTARDGPRTLGQYGPDSSSSVMACSLASPFSGHRTFMFLSVGEGGRVFSRVALERHQEVFAEDLDRSRRAQGACI